MQTFREKRFKTFRGIVFTDKQTNGPTLSKTLPPYFCGTYFSAVSAKRSRESSRTVQTSVMANHAADVNDYLILLFPVTAFSTATHIPEQQYFL